MYLLTPSVLILHQRAGPRFCLRSVLQGLDLMQIDDVPTHSSDHISIIIIIMNT